MFNLENYINELCQQASVMSPRDLKSIFPVKSYTYFTEIMTGIIHYLECELLESNQIDDPDFVQNSRELDEKINICNDYIKENEKTEDEEQGKKNIIFAISKNGNSLIESDIKSIEPEYYDRILEILYRLKHDITPQGKVKILTKESKLKGTIYQKEFAVRVYYINIDIDTVYVLIVKTKHDQKLSKKDLKELVGRKISIDPVLNSLKEQIQNPELKEEIIKTHNQIYQNVVEFLENNKRGEKKNEIVVDSADETVKKTDENIDPEVDSVIEKPEETNVEIEPVLEILEQESPLEEIDMGRENKNQDVKPKESLYKKAWNEKYQLAKVFYEEHGHLRIVRSHPELGEWIHEQRRAKKKGKLSSEKIKLLEEIGMIWRVTSKNDVSIKSAVMTSQDSLQLTSLATIMTEIDSLEVKDLSSVERKIKMIKKKRLTTAFITTYQNLLQLSKQGENALIDFELRIENDTETINKIAIKK